MECDNISLQYFCDSDVHMLIGNIHIGHPFKACNCGVLLPPLVISKININQYVK